MNIIPSTYTVASFYANMISKKIIVNRNYQRSDRVWPEIARSFLIETIILGYPMPKLALYQITDLKSRLTYHEIVDGQQRSSAIRDFFNDTFRLSKSLQTKEIAGKKYSELNEELQQKFIEYPLACDVYVNANSDDIREAFRRMNSYTVPLNPEEQRHAIYQGEMKWFVRDLSSKYDKSFIEAGVFSEKQIVRMADAKLFTELIHAIHHGISTTNKKSLDDVYRKFDREIKAKLSLERSIDFAFEWLFSAEPLYKGALMRHYMVYSLSLAILHLHQPQENLENVFDTVGVRTAAKDTAINNLLALGEALEADGREKEWSEFVAACQEKTNVKRQREIRFVWFCRALSADS